MHKFCSKSHLKSDKVKWSGSFKELIFFFKFNFKNMWIDLPVILMPVVIYLEPLQPAIVLRELILFLQLKQQAALSKNCSCYHEIIERFPLSDF